MYVLQKLRTSSAKAISLILVFAMLFGAVPTDFALAANAVRPEQEGGFISQEVSMNEASDEPAESFGDEDMSVAESSEEAEAADSLKSPVINDDGSVTFNYRPNKAVERVRVAGDFTDWQSGAKDMTDEDGDGVFSVTVSGLKPGSYQYKFIINDNEWVTDPLNTEKEAGNSAFKLIGLVLKADHTAGAGTFPVTAEVPDGTELTAGSVEWSLKAPEGGSLDGISITKDETDETKAAVTITDEAANGYFIVKISATLDGEAVSNEIELYHSKRAFIYEYTYRQDSPYVGRSDIYTWYNSTASNIATAFREVNGKYAAYIPVEDKTKSFGYIVRLFGAWGADENTDREYKDRTCSLWEGEKYVKVKGGEGIEEPYLLPSGKTSYDHGIKFAYRDDELFYLNQMDTISENGVKVLYKAVDETEWTERVMNYNAQDELFTYTVSANALEEGWYDFKFNVEGREVQDRYYGGRIEFRTSELEIKYTLSKEEVTYDDNPVVTFDVSVSGNDAVEGNLVTSIIADLTPLGYEGVQVPFSPETMDGVLYIDRSVSPGTYDVPFEIVDRWGNLHETTVPIKVVERAASTPSWDESNVYFLLTDRFVDGNTSNNYNVDKTKIESYHGGDFAGLTGKLGYLQELGINTIWITPIVDNMDEIQDASTRQQAYHGYWAKNFEAVDEHLGNTDDLDTLIDEAAKRGIKIMVDIVVNHAGYGTEEEFGDMLRSGDDIVPGDVMLDELDHLPDFRTEDAEVRAQLVAWQTAWANHTTPNGNKIAYFRVDTVKHVDHETWQALKTSVTKGDSAFKMIGEYYGAGITNTGDYLGNGQMDALLDFEFKSQAKDFVSGNIDKIETALEERNARMSNSLTMGQFLSSHDEDGFLYSVGNDTNKMKLAAALQLTAKGVPVIYYGEEINLTGPNEYGNQNNNRYDMKFDGLDNEQQSMLSHYKKLLAARNMYIDAFATGSRTKVDGSDAGKYVVFKRAAADETVYVALNMDGAAKEVTFSVDSEEEVLFDAYSGKDVTVESGQVTVTIPAAKDGGTVILGEKKELTDMEINLPNKLAYANGEALDLDGLAVTAYYGDNRVSVSSENYTVDQSAYRKDVQGTYEIKVSYGGFTRSFQVTVAEKAVQPEQPKPSQPEVVQPKAVGTVLKSTSSTYKVTSSAAANPTVEWTGVTSKKATKAAVPATIEADGVTYKVTAIAKNALKGKNKVKKVTIGKNVTTIGNSAFQGCTALKSITIPEGVTSIGSKAFYGDKNLKKITIKSTVLKKVGSKAFKGIHAKATIKVPKKMLKKYQKTLKGKGQAKTVKIKK